MLVLPVSLILGCLWSAAVAWADILPERISYPSVLDLSASIDKQRTCQGALDFLVPLKINSHENQSISLWYGAVQGQYSPSYGRHLSMGIGYRGKGNSYPVYGIYTFLDTIKSVNDQFFFSLNTGVEWFGKMGRAYLNCYVPISAKRQVISQNLGIKFEGHREFHHISHLTEEINPGIDVGGTWWLSQGITASSFAYYVHHYRMGIGIQINCLVDSYAQLGFIYLYDTINQHQMSAKLTLKLGGATSIREITEEYKEPTQRYLAQLSVDNALMIKQFNQEEKKTILDNIQFFSTEGQGVVCTVEQPCHPTYLTQQTQPGDSLYLDENIQHDLQGRLTLKSGQSLHSRCKEFTQPSALGKGATLIGSLNLSGHNEVKGIHLKSKASMPDEVGVFIENAENVALDRVYIGGNSVDTSYATGVQIKGRSDVLIQNSNIKVVQHDKKAAGFLVETGKATLIDNKITVISETEDVLGFKIEDGGQLCLEQNQFLIKTDQANRTTGEALVAFEIRSGKLTANDNQFDLKSEGATLLIGRVIQSQIDQFNRNTVVAHNAQGEVKGLIMISSNVEATHNRVDLNSGKSVQIMSVMPLGGTTNLNLLNNRFMGISEASGTGLQILGNTLTAKLLNNQFLLKTHQDNGTLVGMKLPHNGTFDIARNHFKFSAPSNATVHTQEPEGQSLGFNELGKLIKDEKNNEFVRVADIQTEKE